jgi:hypothetical protein
VIKSVNAVITLEMILDAGACPEQVALFNLRYPLGLFAVTPESVLAVIVDGIDIYWAGKKLLRGEFKRSYDAALAEPGEAYDAAMAEPLKAYHAAIAEALKVFNAAMPEALKVFNAAMAEADKVYDAALAEADKVYNAALAQAFSDAFNAQCRAEVAA